MAASGGRAFGWQELVWLTAVLGGAVFAYHACQAPEPARTALTLASAVCDAAPRDREQLIAAHVAPVLEVEDAEQGAEVRSWSRAELSAKLRELDVMRPSCEVSLRDWELRAPTRGAVWVEGVLDYSASQPSDLHALRRNVRALFSAPPAEHRATADERGEGPRRDSSRSSEENLVLTRLELGPVQRHDPEARP